jgi:hypothetical protein
MYMAWSSILSDNSLLLQILSDGVELYVATIVSVNASGHILTHESGLTLVPHKVTRKRITSISRCITKKTINIGLILCASLS